MSEQIHELKCPHPQCKGIVKISQNLPAGEYQCKCCACTVKLSWAQYIDRGRVPYLALVEAEKTKKLEQSQNAQQNPQESR